MKKRKGFTLIELLITATILSVLTAIAIGVYRSSVRDAKLTDYKNRARAMAYALQQYKEDHPYDAFEEDLSFRKAFFNNMKEWNKYLDRSQISIDEKDLWMTYPCVNNGKESQKNPCSKAQGDFKPLLCLGQNLNTRVPDPNFDDTYAPGCYAFCISATEEREYHNDTCVVAAPEKPEKVKM